MPCSTSSTHAACTVSVFVAKSTPQAIDTAANSSCPAWMTRRQSNRSARAPNGIDSSRNGSQWLNTSKPASTGEW